jgi:hypothetical protein
MKHPDFEVAITTEEVSVAKNSIKNILNKVFTEVGIVIHAIEKTI